MVSKRLESTLYFVPMQCMDEFCSVLASLYRLGHLVEGPEIRKDRRLPVLLRTYAIPNSSMFHVCPIDTRMLRRLLEYPLLIGPISAALTECFWALLDRDIDPSLVSIFVYVSPVINRPYDGETVIRIQIPRDVPIDRIGFWTDIDSKIFARVPHSVLTTLVERVEIESHSFLGFRDELV